MEKEDFVQRLKALMCRKNNKGKKITAYHLERNIDGITSADIYKYLKGTEPGPEKVKLLADYFHVSAGWLLFGEEQAPAFSSDNILVSPSEMWDVLKASVYNQNVQNDHISKLIEMLREKTENDKKETSTCVAV